MYLRIVEFRVCRGGGVWYDVLAWCSLGVVKSMAGVFWTEIIIISFGACSVVGFKGEKWSGGLPSSRIRVLIMIARFNKS